MIFKANCKCGQLYLSETYGGYDTVCNLNGKLCTIVTWDKEKEEYTISDDTQCHPEQPVDKSTVTPQLQSRIDEARQADRDGNTISCRTSEELDAFLDSL